MAAGSIGLCVSLPFLLVLWFIISTSVLGEQSDITREAGLLKPSNTSPTTLWRSLSTSLHPRLYFNSLDLRALKKKAKTTHRHIFKVIQKAVNAMLSNHAIYLPPENHEKFASKWNEVYGNNLPLLALYVSLRPEETAASQFLMKYMDRMAKYPDWMVTTAPDDEVPMAHSLTGFATAYDFAYTFLDEQRQGLYLNKIRSTTQKLYELSKHRGWGKQYLQNHQTTNIMAILIGALVVGEHGDPETMIWKQMVVSYMEKTMFLLNHVVDGSLDEGVAYGSYTAKSITQYVFLALRHFHIDNTQNHWLQAHFWFYLATLLPGFQRTVGIADSNYNWFYGPESQLVFLDTYVLQNGMGNWLADTIRKHRPKDGPMMQSAAQRWATLHTEFIWYSGENGVEPPPGFGTAAMHIFSNWGVVTYGAGLPLGPGNTFLSFKSGKLGGRAVYDIVHAKPYPWVDGWTNFNPGHEHPDQNSFTFAPNGQVFISDALYGPKLSYLNNVLVFSPSPTSHCHQPWEGQLGECGRWLAWGEKEVGNSAGEIVAASYHQGTLFVSGEAVSAYSSAMRLKSVYRALVLLSSQTLLVLDHVEKLSDSPLETLGAFFHNLELDYKYVPYKAFGKYHGALMDVWDAHYKIFWMNSAGLSPVARIQEAEQVAEFKKRYTQFINVTFPMSNPVTRVAYLMHGPYDTVSSPRFLDNSIDGVRFSLNLNGTSTVVSIATNYKDISSRFHYLGFGGFAKSENSKQTIHFGQGIFPSVREPNKLESVSCTRMVVAIAMLLMLFISIKHLRRKRTSSIPFLWLIRYTLFCLLFLWLLDFLLCSSSCAGLVCGTKWDAIRQVYTNSQSVSPSSGVAFTLPSTIITSLPGSGAEILEPLFSNNSDFVYIQISPAHLYLPKTKFELNPIVDACEWSRMDAQRGQLKSIQAWFHSVASNIWLHLQNISEDLNNDKKREINKDTKRRKVIPRPQRESAPRGTARNTRYITYIKQLWHHLATYQNARPVLNLASGGWSLKVPFLQEVIGPPLRAIFVVQDPRSWIYTMLYSSTPSLYSRKNVKKHLAALSQLVNHSDAGSSGQKCIRASPEFREVMQLLLAPQANPDPLTLLAQVWLAHTTATLRINADLAPHSFMRVRFEDIVHFPEDTAMKMHSFLGVPVSPSALNQLMYCTSTNLYRLYDEEVSPNSMSAWKESMSYDDLKAIEEVCSPAMQEFGYERLTR